MRRKESVWLWESVRLRPVQLVRNGPRSPERVCAKSRAPALVRRVDADQKDAPLPHLPHLVVNQPKRFVSSFENERASSRAIFEHAPTMGGDQQPMRNSALATPPRGLNRRRQTYRCSRLAVRRRIPLSLGLHAPNTYQSRRRSRNGQSWHQHLGFTPHASRHAPSTTARKRGVINDS